MGATLIYHSKVRLLHSRTEAVAIAEAKVWKVPKSVHFPEGIKYSLFLALKETGEIVIGFDNHRPKGHHIHKHGKELSYAFSDVDALVEEFWEIVASEGFLL